MYRRRPVAFASDTVPGVSMLGADVVVVGAGSSGAVVAARLAAAGVDVMLVPAWDFVDDAWLHGRVAILRGVENGYSVVRSAREGALTVSDAYGRVTAETPSGPQTAFNAEIPRHSPGPTLYSRIGDAFGWAMLALAALLTGWAFLRRRSA